MVETNAIYEKGDEEAVAPHSALGDEITQL